MSAALVLRVEKITPHTGAGSLRAWCDVIMPGGMRLRGVVLQVKPGRAFARRPRTPRFGPDGRQARHERSGAAVFDQRVVFETVEDQKAFSDAVIDAVRAERPDLLEPRP